EPETHTFTQTKGHTISYCIYGVAGDTDPPPPTIFYFHSHPSSRYEAALLHPTAQRHGLRIVAPDRPGMGESPLDRSRRLLDWPADMLALADHLDTRRFGVVGTSGGGPYVLACCLRLPRARLAGAGVVCGLFPLKLGTSGMMWETRLMLWVAGWAPSLVALGLDFALGKVARDREHPEAFEAAMAKAMESRPEVDRAVIQENAGGFRDAMLENFREALKHGSQGAAYEAKLFSGDWGFKLEDVKMAEGTLVLWHGEKDVNVPVAMAQKAAGLLDGAELRLSPDEGHISLPVNKTDEIMETMK
ncbi:Alpha/Beta hydrolase protein, partial [Lineolata rhizophorae]